MVDNIIFTTENTEDRERLFLMIASVSSVFSVVDILILELLRDLQREAWRSSFMINKIVGMRW